MAQRFCPLLIGLWIGGDHTPNSFKNACEAIASLTPQHSSCSKGSCSLAEENQNPKDNAQKSKRELWTAGEAPIPRSPLVFPQCPWCAADLCIADVRGNEETLRTSFICPDERCFFSAPPESFETSFANRVGLPVLSVDDEILRSCPTIIVGTADKFATLWYRPGSRALFGHVTAFCDRHGYLTPLDGRHKHHGSGLAHPIERLNPIDLFVQDELHLINEALGSAYGLLECAVDALSDVNGLVPKKIGASATIRRATQQARALFDRDTSIFPIAPIDPGESFFAEERQPSAAAPGRLYVGIYAPSQSRLYALDQVIASAMDAAIRVQEVGHESVADPYLTLVLYFNTLRDLGQVQGLLVDDVPKHLGMIADFRGGKARLLHNVKEELTSKTPQEELRETERKLRATFEDEERNGRYGCDAVCATSMLSVGIDIGRLGAMLVDGQPKSSAEYIQATSRVGREKPGIVFTVYNAARPRDLSHYEHFFGYHSALYKYVESPSVTPSSFGTIDKYLANLFIAIFRLDFGFNKDDLPSPFDSQDPRVRRTFDKIAARVLKIGSSREEEYASAALEELVCRWRDAAIRKGLEYVYPSRTFSKKQNEERKKGQYVARISDPLEKAPNVLFAVPMSLRTVEPELLMVLES